MRTALRLLPLLTVPVVAVALMGGDLTHALWVTILAFAKTVGWGIWICGPLSLAVSLAIVSRDAVPRVLAEIMLVLLAVLNLFALLVAGVLPWFSLREVFFYLPFFEFLALSMVVAIALVAIWGKRRIAKKLAPATLSG